MIAHNASQASDGSSNDQAFNYFKLNKPLYDQIIGTQITNGDNPPLASVIMCVYNTPANVLRAAIKSVYAQTYPNWELCIVDDHSSSEATKKALAKFQQDDRIKIYLSSTNKGISQATNNAIGISSGEFVAFMDHDDILLPNALMQCVERLLARSADIVYTDQATVNQKGRIVHEFRKPAWSPEYLRHVMYVGHLLVMRRTTIEATGLFDSRFDGVQDFEYLLRASEKTQKIEHIPVILYHWRAIPGSLAFSETAKDNIAELQAKAVQEHLQRLGIQGLATPLIGHKHRCRVTPNLHTHPKVSIIIPTKDSPELIQRCLQSIFSLTSYSNFEVVCVDTGSTDKNAISILESSHAKLVNFVRDTFNFSAACNFGADHATGDVLIFLNNDTEVITCGWIEELVFYLSIDGVGIAGPLLLYPNDTVQHAGVVIGPRGTADHAMRYFPSSSDGYAGSLTCPREVSAVTGACLAIKKNLFQQLEGFSTLYFTHYQDVDLCLKARELGMRCIFVASARLIHHESLTRGGHYDYLDRLLFIDTWRNIIKSGDRYYNPALSLEKIDYSLKQRTHKLPYYRHLIYTILRKFANKIRSLGFR
jgi:glycosyltransferase involved in cell wall biosynthesis